MFGMEFLLLMTLRLASLTLQCCRILHYNLKLTVATRVAVRTLPPFVEPGP
jgi:hypothetical protein